jgi:hypothetical protein
VCPRVCLLVLACVRRLAQGLEARAFRALPLLCAKRLRLLQLIYIPNNVMATQRERGFYTKKPDENEILITEYGIIYKHSGNS